MKQCLGVFLVSLFSIAIPATAQVAKPDRLLLPVATEREWLGGYGSRWVSDIWVHNESSRPIQLYVDCKLLCPAFVVEPHSSAHAPGILYPIEPSNPGVFMLVEPGGSEGLKASLRIQDVSRQALTWGTEVPVIRERDMVVGKTIHLLDVPIDIRFRQALRVYSTRAEVSQVTLRIFPLLPDGTSASVIEEVLTLSPASDLFPGYSQRIDFLSLWPQLSIYSVVRLELIPNDETAPFWAFVSTTNNETQHVTLSTPRP